MQGISPVETYQHGSKLGLNRQALEIFPQEWVYKNVAIDHQNILVWALGKLNMYCNKVNTCIYMYIYAGWWFGTFFIFPYIGNSIPNWLIFFRGVETTNQIYIYMCVCVCCFLPACELSGIWTKYNQLDTYWLNQAALRIRTSTKLGKTANKNGKVKKSYPELRRLYHFGWSKTELYPNFWHVYNT